ncbi:hypothetical protein BDK92_3295 [Micromonospora pisi]|uniref:Uncharacterized protein n=1 Tax=Micromonospora pisi TaxID=589240 RepID=A0A495JJG4_9ACTN|nr:hypothetical protein [Micromonospora pisi]RKR88961.1 hypothetical protein BDK92_3295 [Micromonospora pisi]
MGTPGNTEGWPENNGPYDGLPELPPDWGPIVIPDDPAELAAEAALIRRELRQRARRAAWRRRLGLSRNSHSALRITMLIMPLAVLAALGSLIAVVWPGQHRQPPAPRVSTGGAPGRTLPALDLVDSEAAPVALRGLLPAVILLTDGCACANQVAAAAGAAPPGVTVIAVTSDRSRPSPLPSPPVAAGSVRNLADPAGELRGLVQVAPQPDHPTAVLVDHTGHIVRILPDLTSPADYQANLPQLTHR